MANSAKMSSWDEFKNHIAKVRESLAGSNELDERLLFRGQSNAGWELASTLDRVGGESMSFSEYYRQASIAQLQIESFTSNRWKLPEWPDIDEQAKKYEFLSFGIGRDEHIYSYLTHLRHHGFPTPILDWSRSLFVASYFAYAQAKEEEWVSIYVLCEAKMHSGGSGQPELKNLGPYVRTHRRHYIQQCEYTLCAIYRDIEWWMTPHERTVKVGDTLEFRGMKYPTNSVICKFDLPARERKSVLKQLDEHNVNAFTLFGSEESLMETLAIRQFELNS